MGRRPIPLSDVGQAQVEALTPHLAGLGIEAVWSSPLVRARATAGIVAAALGGLEVQFDEGLTEVDYAAWEGRRFPDLWHDEEFKRFLDDPIAQAIPGGGESLLDVRARVYDAMERIAVETGGRRTLVVSHGDPLRLVLCGCLHLGLENFRRVRLDNAALSAVELTGDWAEVKFMNLHPDVAGMLDADRRAAPASAPGEPEAPGAARPSSKKNPEGHLPARDRARPRW